MKKAIILFIWALATAAAAQQTDTELTNDNNANIRTKVYSPTRAANMYKALIDSKKGFRVDGTATGTDTYSVAVNSVVTSYITDVVLRIKFTNANTSTTPTLDVNALGARNIKDNAGSNIAAGDIKAGGTYDLVYDGANLRVMNLGGAAFIREAEFPPSLANANPVTEVNNGPNSTVYHVTALAVVITEDGFNGGSIKAEGTFQKNDLGTITQIGTTQITYPPQENIGGSLSLSFDISGNSLSATKSTLNSTTKSLISFSVTQIGLTPNETTLFTQLLQQPNNNGARKLRFNRANSLQSAPLYKGTYNPVTTYSTRDRVSSGNYFDFESAQAVPTNTFPSPIKNTAFWKRLLGVEVIQDLGNGSHMYNSMNYASDDLKKWGQIKRVTLGAQSSELIGFSNIDPGVAIGASSASITLTAVPSVYNMPVASGLSSILFAPVSMGTSSSSMTIVGDIVSPTFQNISLDAGLSLVTGDAIKLENSAVFNIARIITYDALSGAAYIAIINGVGAGSFSIWNVFKVSLIFASWDGAPTAAHFSATVETYDNATGAMTVKTFAQVGFSTRTPWTVIQGKQQAASNGTSIQINQQNQVMGMMIRGRYFGDRLNHVSQKRADACGFRYIIMEGPNAGQEFTIDLYNASLLLNQQTLVASNLAISPDGDGYEFIAFSVASPSLGTNGRTVVNYDYSFIGTLGTNHPSLSHAITTDTYTVNNIMAGGGFSSGEMAINYKKAGTADQLFWFFDHNIIYGFRATTAPTYEVDGVQINTEILSRFDGQFQDFTEFKMMQSGEVFHPDQVAKMADCVSEHIFDETGLYWKFTLTLSQDWEIASSRINMIAFPENGGLRWFDKMTTNLGGEFLWPGGTLDQPITGNLVGWTSALFSSENDTSPGNRDYMIAHWKPVNQWGSGGDMFGYSGGPKLYPSKYANSIMPAGSVLVVEGRIFAGNKGGL